MHVAFLVCTLSVMLSTTAFAQSTTPAPVVGEWAGTYTVAGESREGGQLYIFVKKVDGEKATVARTWTSRGRAERTATTHGRARFAPPTTSC